MLQRTHHHTVAWLKVDSLQNGVDCLSAAWHKRQSVCLRRRQSEKIGQHAARIKYGAGTVQRQLMRAAPRISSCSQHGIAFTIDQFRFWETSERIVEVNQRSFHAISVPSVRSGKPPGHILLRYQAKDCALSLNQALQLLLSPSEDDAEALLIALVDSPAFSYHSIGPDGEFLHISDTELGWIGYKREEIMGKVRFQDLLTPDDRSRFEHRFPRFKEIGIAKDVEYTYVKRDGTTMPISINGTGVYDNNGKFVKTRSIIVDLTQRRQSELISKRMALQQQREDLAALLAHDLKVPLLGSNRLFDLLLNDELGPTTAQQRDIFRTMRASNSLVLEKIRTILEINRYESVDAPLLFKKTPLSIVLERCIAECSKLQVCWEKELTFDCDLLSSSGISVDERAWELLLKNLLNNAMVASPPKSAITVRSVLADDVFQVSIIDRGPGIPLAEQRKLFVRFWQGTTQQMSANTGMGLYLCGKIVSAYGGSISCESTPGAGAKFVVTMPLDFAP